MDSAICFRVCYFFSSLLLFFLFSFISVYFFSFLLLVATIFISLALSLAWFGVLSSVPFELANVCAVWLFVYQGKYFWLLCVSVDLHFRCHGTSTTRNATSFLSSISNTFFFLRLFFLFVWSPISLAIESPLAMQKVVVHGLVQRTSLCNYDTYWSFYVFKPHYIVEFHFFFCSVSNITKPDELHSRRESPVKKTGTSELLKIFL